MKAKFSKKNEWFLPSWLFLVVMTVVYELFLHLGSMDSFLFSRFAVVLVFAVGFACLLGLIASCFPQKAQKWLVVGITFLLAVLYIVQYFVHDAYQVFMTFGSILNGAEGVATNYLNVVVSLLTRSLWKIILLLLPIILFSRLTTPSRCSWKTRIALLCVTLVMYGAGYGIIQIAKVDKAKFSLSCSFDNAVESFGLNMGLGINALQNILGDSMEFDTGFEVPQAPTSQATDPVQTEPSAPQDQETTPDETVAPTEPPKVYRPHELGLDFAAMAETESNQKVASIHSYLASLTPAMENDMTGLFEGKNLIFITAEAFSSHVVDPELTPTLYRLVTEGIHFTDYYQPVWGAGTTGGEYTNLLSLIPYGGSASMEEVNQQDIFHTIGKQLQARGYTSAAFHNNDYTFYNRHQTHTQLGYDVFIGEGNGMEEGISRGWPQSDEEMFRFTIPQYIDQQPFSLYYMTVSGHATYLFNSNTAAKRNQELVEHLPYSEPVRAYLACNLELEHSMRYLLEQLEEKGIADDTVIVIGTDHYPYGLAPSETWGTNKDYLSELYGEKVKNGFIRDKSSLVIWSGCLEDMDLTVDTPTQSLDILPTLSNLFGFAYDSRLMCGRDVFSDQQPVAFWIDYSWKTEKGSYNASTGVFTPVEGVEVEDGYVEYMNSYVRNKFTFSKAVYGHNYFNYVNKALEELAGTTE